MREVIPQSIAKHRVLDFFRSNDALETEPNKPIYTFSDFIVTVVTSNMDLSCIQLSDLQTLSQNLYQA